MYNKPPLGVIPKKYWQQQVNTSRVIDLARAIKSYAEEGLPVDPEWVKEYNELLEVINSGNI